MTVVDASVVVRLLQNRHGDERLRERFGRERHVHAPSLIDAEVASAICRLVMTSRTAAKISVARAEQMLVDFANLPVIRSPMQPFHRRTLALRHNFTAYDAFYVALAESLQMVLLTDDLKFAKAAGHSAVIESCP